MATPSEQLTRVAIELAARQWKALGVRLTGPAHTGAEVLDPEALILFTAALGHTDARLRAESLDWCVRYHRLVSGSRLKNMHSELFGLSGVTAELDAYFAVVNEHGGARWARPVGDRGSTTREFVASGKSVLPPLPHALPLLRLQIRALFGVTARAELLLALASAAGQSRGWSASDLTFTGYSRRNLALVLDELTLSGLVSPLAVKNRTEYRIRQPEGIHALLPNLATAEVPRWDLRFATLTAARVMAAAVESKPALVRSVEARRFVTEHGDALLQLGHSAPGVRSPEAYFDELVDWLVDVLAAQS